MKIERLRFVGTPPFAVVRRKASELDEPGFVGVQAQAELLKVLLKVLQELFGLAAILEPDDEIVRVAHEPMPSTLKFLVQLIKEQV